MNFNFAVKLNIKSRDLESKFYLIIMAIISSLVAIYLYSFALSTYSEDDMNSTSGLYSLKPRITEEITKLPK